MALGDYILCCKCEVKLIYDGDRGQREWWEKRFGKPPEIECPDCKAPASKPWVGLTDEEIARVVSLAGFAPDWAEANIATQIVRVCQDILKEKNT